MFVEVDSDVVQFVGGTAESEPDLGREDPGGRPVLCEPGADGYQAGHRVEEAVAFQDLCEGLCGLRLRGCGQMLGECRYLLGEVVREGLGVVDGHALSGTVRARAAARGHGVRRVGYLWVVPARAGCGHGAEVAAQEEDRQAGAAGVRDRRRVVGGLLDLETPDWSVGGRPGPGVAGRDGDGRGQRRRGGELDGAGGSAAGAWAGAVLACWARWSANVCAQAVTSYTSGSMLTL